MLFLTKVDINIIATCLAMYLFQSYYTPKAAISDKVIQAAHEIEIHIWYNTRVRESRRERTVILKKNITKICFFLVSMAHVIFQLRCFFSSATRHYYYTDLSVRHFMYSNYQTNDGINKASRSYPYSTRISQVIFLLIT